MFTSSSELTERGICKDLIFAMISVRGVNLFPNSSMKDVVKTAVPAIHHRFDER
jgi:hypothetical protein